MKQNLRHKKTSEFENQQNTYKLNTIQIIFKNNLI